MTMRRLSVLAAAVVALVAVALLRIPAVADDRDDPRPVVSDIIRDHGIEARWLPGVVQSRTQVNLGFETLGRMIARPVDVGARVRAGDLLAELAVDDLQAVTRAARAALATAEVNDRTARAALDRAQALSARNVAPAAQLELAQQAASAAAAAVEQARSALIQAQDAEGFARMTAPFDGVISAVFEAPGTTVGAGVPVLQLSAYDQREAVIDLPEPALRALERGAVFTVWHRNDADTQVPAVLDRIDPVADAATRTRRVYLTLPPDAPFRLGGLVRARQGPVDTPALSLDPRAVMTTDDGAFVWRVTRDGAQARVTRVAVTLGPEMAGRVPVLSGLNPGDEIVLRGVNSLTDGHIVGRRLEP
ncbi:efflux RND transporter periplasmic adaptor subunit [Paracoccus sp. (in: a-proteobacteria)]|uniref:efflux RND transporter periplasmic adaptor subunit n=1 Tax=Paracoccus sp. TaxID=267 RepID=UPI0026E07C1F|nr:efflux RND transporter periplasmic adaptor subunit [Paracoccus sp. (in: a-proteobacteria)]MDO5647738.1 efflux RND transporter periplasmic adaptor subunit [Paracoccus sp. (in: a-proteobacteria)]